MKLKIIIMAFLLITPLLGNKVIPLPDLLNPESISIDKTQMYITEKSNVYIYSLGDFKLLKKFGKAGSGPKEFLVSGQAQLFLNSQGKDLVISSQLKVSIYNKKGEYIKENRVTALFSSFFRPFQGKFVGTKLVVENNIMYFTVDIFDKNFNQVKRLFKQKHFFQQGKKMNPVGRLPLFFIYKNKVYVENATGNIHVFDTTGKEVKIISPKFKPVPLTKAHKTQVINFFKNDPQIKQYWNLFKDNLEFPKYFPNLRQTIVSDGLIYMQTWRVEDGKSEIIIYDIDGNSVKNLMISLPDVELMSRNPIAVHQNKIYQIVENIDEEQWELNIIDIK